MSRLPPFVLLVALLASSLPAQEVDPSLLSSMRARNIGPAGMSGRIAAIDGLASDPNVLWVGAATGGVWKSTNGGVTWAPVFDDQPVSGIGAIAIDQNAPDVVWVGTGEGNPRNSEGDFIQLADGRLLFVYTHFTGGNEDHSTAFLAGRYSDDGGLTWTTEDVTIVPNEGRQNVMSVSLLRLQNGQITLFFLVKNSD